MMMTTLTMIKSSRYVTLSFSLFLPPPTRLDFGLFFFPNLEMAVKPPRQVGSAPDTFVLDGEVRSVYFLWDVGLWIFVLFLFSSLGASFSKRCVSWHLAGQAICFSSGALFIPANISLVLLLDWVVFSCLSKVCWLVLGEEGEGEFLSVLRLSADTTKSRL